MFTPAVVQQALALKSALKVEKMAAFSALALMGASAERAKAYADKVAGVTAVIVIGEDALKAAAHVEFSVPIILLNAAGPTAAKGRIIRLFDAASAAAPATAKAVTSPAAVAALIGTDKEVALKGDVVPTLQALLAALKRGGDRLAIEQLQAAIVLTFARFVEWSPEDFTSPSAPIVVGIVADEGVALALETIAKGKNVAGRTIAVKRLQWDSSLADLHMIFVADTEKRHFALILERIGSGKIVTISGMADFGRAGGMISLTVIAGRISFAVNSHATAARAVRLSSSLLSHATKVSDESSGGAR